MTGADTDPQKGGGFVLELNNAMPSVLVHPYAIMTVRSHVPIILHMKNSNYSMWASFFKSMCGKFGLKSHIDNSIPPRPTDPNWDQADCCIRSWIFGSVNDFVLNLGMSGDVQTARAL
jgi:hypothetical protein